MDKPEAIARYAKWALKSDGPMVWQTPTPIECTVKSNDPQYIVRVLLCRLTFTFDQINSGSGEYI